MASINLSWTASTPAPVNGYRIKYWPTTYPTQIITVAPNVIGTSYTLNVATGVSYSGTIEASCTGGTYSTPVSWSVVAGGGTSSENYNYWDMQEVNCTTGDVIAYNVTVALPLGYTPLAHKYYQPISGGNSVYRNNITAEAPQTIGMPILSNVPYSTYTDACAVLPA